MTETIVVGVDHGNGKCERVRVRGVRTEWDRDGTLHIYNDDGTDIAEFPNALYAVRVDNLED